MLVTLSVPEESVGDVIGDLNSRRGRPQGMEPSGLMTEVKAEVPMAEMVTYAPDLRALTGGRGEYTMEFLRYEEVPAHLAQKVVQEAQQRDRGCGVAPGAIASEAMTRKAITTSHAAVSCDVCGRTLLRGEEAEPFIAGGTRRLVCNLCTARAANEGWIRRGPGRHAERAPPRARASRLAAAAPARPRCGARGAAAARRGAARIDGAEPEPAPPPAAAAPPSPPPREEPAWEPPREQRRVHAIPTHADLKRARAVELFNSSRHRRTVAGVARSLGAPLVAVRPSVDRGLDRLDRGRLGALLVSLRGRPCRRGGGRAPRRPGRRAHGARARGPGAERRRRRARRPCDSGSESDTGTWPDGRCPRHPYLPLESRSNSLRCPLNHDLLRRPRRARA